MKVAELMNVVESVKTALPVSMDCVYADNGLLKTGNPYKNAVKMNTISGIIGMDYERGVNNQLGREDKEMSFEAQKPVWMKHYGNNLGTNAKGDRFYLPIKVQSASKSVYLLDGVDVTDKVQEFIPAKKAPATQDALDKKVIWRTPALDSIQKIRMLGAEFTIEV